MKRLVLALFLAACSKPAPPAATGSTTKLAPVSAEESRSIVAAIRFGTGVSPGQTLQPAASCADFLKNHTDFMPGTLEVPEDWEHPDTSPKIQVFYYWRKGSESGAAGRPPVVFFNGGPASDSHGSADSLANLPFTEHSAFVFLDQRGTGCSTPFPTEVNDATAERLMNWGSRAIVGDAEAVRKHLFGNQRWRVYGQSFGGLVVQRYLEMAPEGLDRAIAHGYSVMADPTDWILERIRSQQRVADSYFAQYPSDRKSLALTRAQIPASQCWTSGQYKSCGPAVLDSLTILLGFQDSWPALHAWIQALRGTPGQVSASVLDEFVRKILFGVYGQAGLAGDVISKMEITPGYTDQEGCAAVMARMRAGGEKPDAFDVNECRMLASLQTPFDGPLSKVDARPLSLAKIAANLSLGSPPFFLFSGQQDVFVPVATFDEEVKFLGARAHYESFPNSGHEGYYTEPHVIGAVVGE